jgi:hypothetical protein
MPFADFTHPYLFEPIGMTATSWRDDYTHIQTPYKGGRPERQPSQEVCSSGDFDFVERGAGTYRR